MRSFLSSLLKWLMLLVRRMTFLKEKGESALFQGSRSLGEKRSRVFAGCRSKGMPACKERKHGESPRGWGVSQGKT